MWLVTHEIGSGTKEGVEKTTGSAQGELNLESELNALLVAAEQRTSSGKGRTWAVGITVHQSVAHVIASPQTGMEPPKRRQNPARSTTAFPSFREVKTHTR